MRGWSSFAKRASAAVVPLLLFVGFASPALAAPGHRYSQTFGTADLAAAGAVAASNDDFFVYDTSAFRLQRFTTDGLAGGTIDLSSSVYQFAPVSLARDQATGDVFVAGTDPNTFGQTVLRFSASGTPGATVDLSSVPNGVGQIGGIATDPRAGDGRLYVSDAANNVVLVFSGSGDYVGQFGSPGTDPGQLSSPGQVAVDGAGNVYVTDSGGARTQKFTVTSPGVTPLVATSQGPVGAGTARFIAGDPTAAGVYMLEAPDGGTYGISRYDGSRARVERFGQTSAIQSSQGFSVNAAQSVFVSYTDFSSDPPKNAVDVYEPFEAPGVTTRAPATNVDATSATVSGTINPAQRPTTYRFEYGLDANYGQQTAITGAGSGNADVDVSAVLAGLQPNATYHYRLVGTNSLGSAFGDDQTFTTDAVPPTVVTQGSANVKEDSATISAVVNPNNSPTTASFEYGPVGSPFTSTQQQDLGASGAGVPITANLSGLKPETTYRFRVVADNGVAGSPTRGADQTFTTPPRMPLASPAAASAVTQSSAQLNGSVDTQGLAAVYSFQVDALNSPYSVTTAPIALAAGSGTRSVSAPIVGLPPGGVFSVRLRVETTTGTRISDETSTFSTPAGAPAFAPTPPIVASPFPYGCAAPRINAPRGTLKAGRSVALTGSDLGVTGTVSFGRRQGNITSYSSNRVNVTVPKETSGRVPVTVTCGKASNTVKARVTSSTPSNRFSLKVSVRGGRASVSARLPARGTVSVGGKHVISTRRRASKAGVLTLNVRLTRAAQSRLSREGRSRLRTKITVRYRPAGGVTRSTSRTVTYRGS